MERKKKTCTDINPRNIDSHLLAGFQFAKLFEIPSMDYELISKAVANLKCVVTLKEFFKNIDGCLNTTLEFIRVYSYTLIKSAEGSSTLASLLDLLRDVIVGINVADFPISSAGMSDILTLLLNILECSLQDTVKHQLGNIVTALIEIQNVDLCKNAEFISLISKVFILLKEGEHKFELNFLLEAVLRWRRCLKIDMRPMIEAVEFQCKAYLNQETDTQLLQQILKCLLTYYETRQERNYVTDTLKGFLNQLCVFMFTPSLRKSIEKLLVLLIDELYCTQPVIWPGGSGAILKEVEALPDSYQKWPHVDRSVFFVIAYLSFLHSKLLWSCDVIGKCLKQYILKNMFPKPFLLKALVMLYPIAVNNNSVHDNRCSRVLIDSLGACKSLSELLSYHPSQMMWLLTNAKTMKIKVMSMLSWLRTENDDAPIVSVLDSTKMGFLLVKFFQNYSEVAVSPRVLQLITKLTPEPNLEKTIETALPLICTRPKVFAQLLQIKPTIPVDFVDRLNLINAISASLPFLTEDTAIQATCYYSIRLLDSTKNQSNALLTFCHYTVSIKFLIAKSASAEDATAIAAIKLLRRLVNNQLINKATVENDAVIQFPTVLRGNLLRMSAGLKLLQTLLNINDGILLLNIDKQSLFGLYHFMHTLIMQQETAAPAYKVLRRLILRENNFAFSLATKYTLASVCKKDVDSETIQPFLEFVEEWLKHVIPYPFVEVPVAHLLILFDDIGVNSNVHRSLFKLIAKYQKVQVLT